MSCLKARNAAVRHQQRRRRKPKRSRSRVRWFSLLLIVTISLGIGLDYLQTHLTKPQALLVLGGDHTRELFAAQFALQHPQLPVWISSGSNREYAEWVFDRAGIPRDRVHLDYQAVDTVTNFTVMARVFAEHNIHSVYLITSDYHMRRARVIGAIVFGSRNIHIHPITVPSRRQPEPIGKAIRDGLRALIWLCTGYTGTSIHQ